MEIRFHDENEEIKFKYAVIICRYHGQWLFCKHKKRSTYECPGGHWEEGESILETAERELYEETGALEYDLEKIGPYSTSYENEEIYGMLFFAEIYKLGKLPEEFEMEKLELFDELSAVPGWTYPEIQPALFRRVKGVKNL